MRTLTSDRSVLNGVRRLATVIGGTSTPVACVFVICSRYRTLMRHIRTVWCVCCIACGVRLRGRAARARYARGTRAVDGAGGELASRDGKLQIRATVPRQQLNISLAGVIGFYGRSTPLTWEDAQKIEGARVNALRARGIVTGTPRAQLYEKRHTGLQHTHAYAYAAAAIVDQVHRALEGATETPARIATEAALAETCWRLACRNVHPMEWNPHHLLDGPEGLNDDLVMEAYLRARTYLRLRGRLIRGVTEGPLASRKWQWGAERESIEGPKLFEATEGEWDTNGKKCAFSRALAKLGIATWRDILDRNGEVKSWSEIKKVFGTVCAAREQEELRRVKKELQQPHWNEQKEKWKKEWKETTLGVLTWEEEKKKMIHNGEMGRVKFITELHVTEKARKKGCAKQLMRDMIGDAEEVQLIVTTREEQKEARALYRDLGFVDATREEVRTCHAHTPHKDETLMYIRAADLRTDARK
jgi:GNAT superfamily N-acetyltransferase